MTRINKGTVAVLLAVITVFGFMGTAMVLSLKAEAIGGIFDRFTSESDPAVTDPVNTGTETTAPTTTTAPETTAVAVEEMRFVNEELTLRIGESAQLEIVVSPEGAELPEVTYKSSAPETVEVDENGKITAKKSGKAVITATITSGGKEVSCTCDIIASSSSIRLETLTNTGLKIVSGFTVGMTVEDVITEIAMMKEITPDKITVTKDGSPVQNGDSIATGMIVSIEGAEHAAILYGDVNGDGLINSDDTRTITDYITGADTLTTEPQLLAADVLHENEITIRSALVIQRHIFEYQTIEQ